MREDEVLVGPSRVISDQISINDFEFYALIDSGALYSYMSSRQMHKLLWKTEKFSYPFITATPAGELYESINWFKEIPIRTGTRTMTANLIVIDMDDFVVILGMDWLSREGVKIDCKSGKVIFLVLNGESFEFRGTPRGRTTPLISAMEARRHLRQGYEGYLAMVVNTTQIMKKIQDVPVVREFMEVFPNDLPRLSPDREIEFSIDLVLRAAPISKASYRVGPAELKELKAQLEELLEKGFVKKKDGSCDYASTIGDSIK